MSHILVLIPCRLDRRDARHALIEDADGFPRKVLGTLGKVDDRLVVAAAWLREANGRHRVRFECGTEFWTVYGPRPEFDFVRLGGSAPPVAAGACRAEGNH
jgi:hypothetical protein